MHLIKNYAGNTGVNHILLSINPESHQVANNLQGVAIQDLYKALKTKGVINSIPLFEEHKPPETIIEERQLQQRKIVSLVKAI